MYFYRCNFTGRKIHVVSMYFFRYNFDGRKIYVVSTYFFRCNLSGWNMHVVFNYFYRRNFDGQKFDIVFGKLSANEIIWGDFSCVCNFKQLTFARLLSLSFSSKSPWCSPVSLKFESCNLYHCKRNYHKLVFLVFTKHYFTKKFLGGYISMKLLLYKSVRNQYYKKVKQRFSIKKDL